LPLILCYIFLLNVLSMSSSFGALFLNILASCSMYVCMYVSAPDLFLQSPAYSKYIGATTHFCWFPWPSPTKTWEKHFQNGTRFPALLAYAVSGSVDTPYSAPETSSHTPEVGYSVLVYNSKYAESCSPSQRWIDHGPSSVGL
jgi:hypothetical protein